MKIVAISICSFENKEEKTENSTNENGEQPTG